MLSVLRDLVWAERSEDFAAEPRMDLEPIVRGYRQLEYYAAPGENG